MEEQINSNNMSYANFISIAKDLIEITDAILKQVVSQTEEAALSIGEKIQTLSTLSDDQSTILKNILTNIYTDGTVENEEITNISNTTNSFVDKMLFYAQNGELDEVKKIGDSKEYNMLKQHTSSLAKQLEHLSQTDQNVAETLGPVIMALQFQDSVRQSLENIIRSFNVFFITMSCFKHEKLPAETATTFWQQIEGQFTSVKDRNIIKEIVYGPDAKLEDSIVGGMFF